MQSPSVIKKRGKRKTQNPCPGCGLHLQNCICAQIPRIEVATKLLLVIHTKEMKRTTNTGTLALKALSNSEIVIRGKTKEPVDLTPSLKGPYTSLLFYPGADSVPLTKEFVASLVPPIQLIVPDGNWRQASKVSSRHPELGSIPRVTIAEVNSATLHLRRESSPEGMATLQAIAEAFGVLENEEVKKSLLALYQLKLEKTLQSRGQVIPIEN